MEFKGCLAPLDIAQRALNWYQPSRW